MNTEKSKVLNELETLKEKAQALITERLGDNFVLEHSIPCIWKTRCWKVKPLFVDGDEYNGKTYRCIMNFKFYVQYANVQDENLASQNCIKALRQLITNLKATDEFAAHKFDVSFRRAVTSYKCRR